MMGFTQWAEILWQLSKDPTAAKRFAKSLALAKAEVTKWAPNVKWDNTDVSLYETRYRAAVESSEALGYWPFYGLKGRPKKKPPPVSFTTCPRDCIPKVQLIEMGDLIIGMRSLGPTATAGGLMGWLMIDDRNFDSYDHNQFMDILLRLPANELPLYRPELMSCGRSLPRR